MVEEHPQPLLCYHATTAEVPLSKDPNPQHMKNWTEPVLDTVYG